MMETKIKNYLGIAAIIVLFAFALAALSYVNTYSKSVQPSSFRSFTVSGEGKVVAVPDVAQFSYQVITQGGTNVAALRQENTKKSNDIIQFLKDNGVDKKDIQTTGLMIQPRYQTYACDYRSITPGGSVPQPCPPASIVGYEIIQSVSVKIRDFEKSGTILGGIADKGANSVSQLNFTVDDPTKLQDQARTDAIAKAKEKASAIAKAGGFGLGKLLNIQEGYSPTPYFYSKDAFGRGGEGVPAPAMAEAPVIEPGSQEIRVSMTLTYEIQ